MIVDPNAVRRHRIVAESPATRPRRSTGDESGRQNRVGRNQNRAGSHQPTDGGGTPQPTHANIVKSLPCRRVDDNGDRKDENEDGELGASEERDRHRQKSDSVPASRLMVRRGDKREHRPAERRIGNRLGQEK